MRVFFRLHLCATGCLQRVQMESYQGITSGYVLQERHQLDLANLR